VIFFTFSLLSCGFDSIRFHPNLLDCFFNELGVEIPEIQSFVPVNISMKDSAGKDFHLKKFGTNIRISANSPVFVESFEIFHHAYENSVPPYEISSEFR
jgi:hypothetical protein